MVPQKSQLNIVMVRSLTCYLIWDSITTTWRTRTGLIPSTNLLISSPFPLILTHTFPSYPDQDITQGAMTFGKEGTNGARVHNVKDVEAILDEFLKHGHTEASIISFVRLYS